MSAAAVAAAGGVLALPRAATTLLPRVLGLYIAACAGTLQLLDIVVERLHLDDRLFTFAIILAVIGVPFAAAAALLAETARAERRRPSDQSEMPEVSSTQANVPAAKMAGAARPVDAERLHRRLDIALSYHQIALLSVQEQGQPTPETDRARAEIEALMAELQRLLDQTGPPKPPD